LKILIAEDEPVPRHLLGDILTKWGYDVIVAQDGIEAWQVLQADDAPQIAILDWMMPGLNGPDVCRKVRQELRKPYYTYIILLTAHQQDKDLIVGMEAGADDYITKPTKINELRVRLNAGRRLVELQSELATYAAKLEIANRDLERIRVDKKEVHLP